MATYLVCKPEDDYTLILTEVEAKNLTRAVESLALGDGESVVVYRIAAGPRVVRVETETIRKLKVE